MGMIDSMLSMMGANYNNASEGKAVVLYTVNRFRRQPSPTEVLKPKEDDIPAYENHAIKELNKMLTYGVIE